jgi:CBS domain-containing protein
MVTIKLAYIKKFPYRHCLISDERMILRMTEQVVSRVDTASDVMTGWVLTISPSESLLKATDLMTNSRVSQLVVVDWGDGAVGLISKRDIARFLLEDTTTRSLEEMSVSEAASASIPTIREDFPVFNAARMFDTENLAYAIVTDDKPIIGIMTETDLCNYFARKFPGKFEVREFMAADFTFAKSSYPVIHVAQSIVFRQRGIPVIEEKLVGILTLSDLLHIKEQAPNHWRLSLHSRSQNDAALLTTRELMTKDPVTTREDADLAQAAQIMINKGIGSLPVVDEEMRVTGLLVKHDIVRALGRMGSNMAPDA